MEQVKKVWGEEKWIINNELYCYKKLYVHKGYRCSRHHHKVKDETFYIVDGRLFIELQPDGGESRFITAISGDTIRVKPNTWHWFGGVEETLMYEISTHHEDDDSYRDESQLSGEFKQ